MVVHVIFFHSFLDSLQQERGILDIGPLKGGLNDPSWNRKDKMILQFPILHRELNAADVGRRHLDGRMGKGMCDKEIFEFSRDRYHACSPRSFHERHLI